MTDRVQFREDPGTLAYLEDKGINPNELARRLLADEVRRMRVKEAFTRLRKAKIRLTRPAAELVREGRRERDARPPR